MQKPNFYISEENFRALIGPGYWSIQDLPPARAEIVRPFLASKDTLGVFASGLAPQSIASVCDVVGGVDWARLESNLKSQEPPVSVYHFVIKAPDENGYPVYACQNNESIAPHWSEWQDLEVYMSSHRSPQGESDGSTETKAGCDRRASATRVDFESLWNYAVKYRRSIEEAMDLFPMFSRDQIAAMFEIMERQDISEQFRLKKALGRNWLDASSLPAKQVKRALLEDVSPWQENAIKALEGDE
ncbi:MAG: hypothetical protein K2X38_07850 [Gemmataceae bacterium]|nr:hypothetical protein [Gemmataceae bacterium]